MEFFEKNGNHVIDAFMFQETVQTPLGYINSIKSPIHFTIDEEIIICQSSWTYSKLAQRKGSQHPCNKSQPLPGNTSTSVPIMHTFGKKRYFDDYIFGHNYRWGQSQTPTRNDTHQTYISVKQLPGKYKISVYRWEKKGQWTFTSRLYRRTFRWPAIHKTSGQYQNQFHSTGKSLPFNV